MRRPVRRRLGRAIDSFLELREGDLVVHVAHGIGRYRGHEAAGEGRPGRRAPGARVPRRHEALRAQLEDRAGAEVRRRDEEPAHAGQARRPAWGRQKEAVEEAVTDLAADMLELQAARAARPGIAFPPDTEWQREFDASFPYHETADQLTTIEAIKDDMARPRPMDRLLCGDVGFGKTEVAMRAAFKAVDAGYQVAVLVPTTVLAEQHYRTFTERMAEFPFEIAVLSRFATRKQQAEIDRAAGRRARSTSSSAPTGWPSTTCSSRTWGW